MEHFITLEYIAWRPRHIDGYVGHVWDSTGDVHAVPASIAQVMLRKHPDVYKLHDASEADLAAAIEQEDNKDAEINEMREIEDQATRDQVLRMEKDKVVEFIQAKFGKRMDKRQSVENLRKEAITMIDLYGLP